MVSLRDMLSEAVGREWADKNLATDVTLKRRGRDAGQVVIPTKEETQLIPSSAEEDVAKFEKLESDLPAA